MSNNRLMQVLLSQRITEKSSFLGDKNGQYVFKVMKNANKIEIRQAIEQLFNVKVSQVRVLNVKPKQIRERQKVPGTRKGWKKAYISLAEGHNINFAETAV